MLCDMLKKKKDTSQWLLILHMLVSLSIPTILEQIFASLLQYVDTAMVGRLGEEATASVSVSTTITWLINSIPGAVGIGVLAMIAKASGAGDKKLVKRIAGQAVFLVSVIGIVVGGICMLLSPFIPIWMGAEEAIRHNASTYFFWISVPMIFRCASIVFGAAIRATKDTKTPLLISMGSNVANVLLNYFCIYVLDLGVLGASIASALSYIIAGTLMFIVFCKNKEIQFSMHNVLPQEDILIECAKISFPVLGTNIASCLGYVVFAGLVSGMGTTIFAAHSIAVTAEEIFYMPGFGFRTATSTLVGNALGEKDRNKFRIVSILSILITVIMMCINGTILYFTAYPLMRIFTPSVDVALLGAQVLRMVAFSEPFFGIMIVMEGIFYGLSNTKYAFFVETFSMWCIRIVFTFLCVKVWGLDLFAVWVCMIADNVCKAILFVIPTFSKKGRKILFHF